MIYIFGVCVCMIQLVLCVYTNIIKSTTNNVNSNFWIIATTVVIVIQSLQYYKTTFKTMRLYNKTMSQLHFRRSKC